MNYDFDTEQNGSLSVSEPAAEYGAATGRTLRTLSDEELSRCMTLEELDQHLTELIYKHYHPTTT